MSAAHYLAVLGYSVTVFEAMEKAGGMLRYAECRITGSRRWS